MKWRRAINIQHKISGCVGRLLYVPHVDSQVFKKYSQMKLQMTREALQKINRQAN